MGTGNDRRDRFREPNLSPFAAAGSAPSIRYDDFFLRPRLGCLCLRRPRKRFVLVCFSVRPICCKKPPKLNPKSSVIFALSSGKTNCCPRRDRSFTTVSVKLANCEPFLFLATLWE